MSPSVNNDHPMSKFCCQAMLKFARFLVASTFSQILLCVNVIWFPAFAFFVQRAFFYTQPTQFVYSHFLMQNIHQTLFCKWFYIQLTQFVYSCFCMHNTYQTLFCNLTYSQLLFLTLGCLFLLSKCDVCMKTFRSYCKLFYLSYIFWLFCSLSWLTIPAFY